MEFLIDEKGENHLDTRKSDPVSVILKPNFWTDYCKLIVENKENIYLAEKTGNYCPIVIRFNFIFYKNINKRKEAISDQLIFELIQNFQQILKNNFGKNIDLLCQLCESPPFMSGMLNHIIIQISFPKIKIETNLIEIIHKQFFIKMIEMKFLDRCSIIPIDDKNEFIDPKIPKILIPLFGSHYVARIMSKNKNDFFCLLDEPPLQMTHLLNDGIEQKLEESFEIDNKYLDISKSFVFWLPLFFSLDYRQKITVQIEDNSVIHFLQEYFSFDNWPKKNNEDILDKSHKNLFPNVTYIEIRSVLDRFKNFNCGFIEIKNYLDSFLERTKCRHKNSGYAGIRILTKTETKYREKIKSPDIKIEIINI